MAVVTGLGNVLRALRARMKKHAAGVERGLEEAAKFLLGKSNYLVPIDTGATLASGLTRKEGSGFNTVAIVSYGTDYAGYMHEDLSKAHGSAFNLKYAHQISTGLVKSRRPQEQAKFLETALRDPGNIEIITFIVQREAEK